MPLRPLPILIFLRPFRADCDLRISRAMLSRFLWLCALFYASKTAHAQDTYRIYRNARYGTTVLYPANLVAPQPESARGSGRKWVSRDGQIEVNSYAFLNRSNRSARGEMNRALTDWKRDTARVTYARSGASWFVLSGYLGADIFYEKTLLRDGVFHTLIWQYPQNLKKRLDPILTRSALAFSAGKKTRTPAFKFAPTAAPVVVVQPTPRASIRRQPTPRPTAAPVEKPAAPRDSSGY